MKLLFAGDYSPQERFQEKIDNNEWQDMFPGIVSLLKSCDYSVVNFESCIPSINDMPISKRGSHLKTNKISLIVLQKLGFNMITLANNHALDYGANALRNTVNEAKVLGLDTVGVGNNINEASKYKKIDIKGKSLAFINACEVEFSCATETTLGCNPLDAISLSYNIKDARENNDYVIVIIHGGNEHYQLPSPRMKKLYRFFVDCGADVVVNHHQHCFSGYEYYKGKPIVYGLGNFCFDSKSDNELRHNTYNYGYLLLLSLNDSKVSIKTIPYEQCYTKVGTYLLDDRWAFDSQIAKLNDIIADDIRLSESFHQRAVSMKKDTYTFMCPITNRILSSLVSRGFFPSFIKKKNLKLLRAKLLCDAHKDVLLENLKDE